MEKRKPKNESADNPFSFRNFLTTPHSSSNTNEPSSSNGAASHVTVDNSNYSPYSNRRREGNERVSNPYSFARFIQNPALSVRADNGHLLQGELPDFVQDHFSSSNVDVNHRGGLPDFTFHTHNETGSSLTPVSPASSPDDLFTSHIHEDNARFAISTSANLPDFLSDTGINIIPSVNDPPQISDLSLSTVSLSNVNGIQSDSVDDDEISTRVKELEQESSQKSVRIHQLEQQLSDQKRKEEEETEVMETMMRQVDDNLAKAVERWQKSEIEVERLSVKVRLLESRLGRVQLETSHAPMHLVRHFGAQLSLDLIKADDLMRQFLEHSDKMKTLAGHLQCLDRVEEGPLSDSDQSRP